MEARNHKPHWPKNNRMAPSLSPVANSMLPPPPKIHKEKEKDWDDSMSIATSGGLPALSVYETEEEEFRRQAVLEGKIPSEFELSYKCTYCAICSSKFSTAKEGLEHFRKKHYKKRCPKCFMVFSSTGNVFKDHLATHFVISKSRLEHIQCVYCVDKIYHYEDLWDHLEIEHLTNLDKEKTASAMDDKNVNRDSFPVTEESFSPFSEIPQCNYLLQQTHQNDFVDVPGNVTLFTPDNVLELCLGNDNVCAFIGSTENTLISSSSAYTDSDAETIDIPIQGRKGFTDDQKRHLIKSFLEDPNPPWDLRAKHFSHHLKCDNFQKISNWFKSERHKFVKGNFPMWAKSPAGMPAYRSYLLPNGKLQILPMQGRDTATSCGDFNINHFMEGGLENTELLKPAGMTVRSNDITPTPIDSNSEGAENIFADCGRRRDSEKLTEVVKIKIENDVIRESEHSSGYESDESCVTKIFSNKISKRNTDANKERRASSSRESDTKTLTIGNDSTIKIQDVATTHIKIEKDEISKTQDVTSSQNSISSFSRMKENNTVKQRRLSDEAAEAVKIKAEKDDSPESASGYESDDSTVTQVFLPERSKILAAFNKWKASNSQETARNGQTKVIKVEKSNEESIEVDFKQPANVTTTGGNQIKQFEDKSRRNEPEASSSVTERKDREAAIDINFKRPSNIRITKNDGKKSLGEGSKRKNDVSRTSSHSPPIGKLGNDNSCDRRRSFNNENTESVEKEREIKKRKLNGDDKYNMGSTAPKSHKREAKENSGEIKNSVESPKKNENSSTSFKFKIPKLPQKINKAKQTKNPQPQNDSKNIVPRSQNNSSKSAAREVCKPNILPPPERPSVESSSQYQQRVVSKFPMPIPCNPSTSRGNPTETNSIEQPVRLQRNSNNKMGGRPGIGVESQPPKRRRRRCGTPIGQTLAPVVTTQQLKERLKEREEKARNERQEKLRQAEIKKRREELEKELELNEKQAKWAAQRLKFFSK